MDGKGRALDNIMIERLWRSLRRDGSASRGPCATAAGAAFRLNSMNHVSSICVAAPFASEAAGLLLACGQELG